MAKTYLTTDNSRGKAVTAANPSFVHIRGWDCGVYVRAYSDGDVFEVYATRGSNNDSKVHLGTLRIKEGSVIFEEGDNVDRHDVVNI